MIPSPVTLPVPLRRQFQRLERRLHRAEAMVAFCGAVGSILLSLLLLFSLDRLCETPRILRLILSLAGCTSFAFFSWRYANRWLWRRPSVHLLARLVQGRHPALGDCLLGIVELADPASRSDLYSPELCRAAIGQVAAQAASCDFEQAAPLRKPRRYLALFLLLSLLAAALLLSAPGAAWSTLLRWLKPAALIPRYTFVLFDPLPDPLVIPQGEPFNIDLSLSANSRWHPAMGRATLDGQPPAGAPFRNGTAWFAFPPQTRDRLLTFSAGDARQSIRIQPRLRPELDHLDLHLVLPAYLRYPPLDQRISGATISFLPGTVATFSAQAARELDSASLAGGKPLRIRGRTFTTQPLLLELERSLTFTWRDKLRLAGSAPCTLHLVPREDAPPAVELRGLPAAVAILPDETLPIDVAATDDYGVRSISLSIQPAIPPGAPGAGPDTAPRQIPLAEGQPQAASLIGHCRFSPALLGIPEDTTLLLRGLATDYYPGREPSSTPAYRVHVLSRESHARLIHDQFDKLLAQLEELTRRQADLLQASRYLRAQQKGALASPESARKLAELSAQQRETASQLQAIARDTASTLNEALRNPLISPETLSAWARHAAQMSSIASTQMPAAAQSLDSAASDSSGRSAHLADASTRQQAILDALHSLQQRANNDLESLMAETLSARLRRAARTENSIASSLLASLPSNIGLTPAQLPPDARSALDSLSSAHSGVTRESARLQEEIARLFDRTSLVRYGDVAREMDAAKAPDALALVGSRLAKNITTQSIDDTSLWAQQLNHWADRLASSDNSHSNPPGPAGQLDPATLRAMLALMQLRRQQDQLRDQTSLLDQLPRPSPDYHAGAQAATSTQGRLRDQVHSFQQDAAFPIPAQPLAPVASAMADAAALLGKPETGHPTNAAQTDAINLLDALIAQEGKKSGSAASALMALLGGSFGSGSGSTAGASSSSPDASAPGSAEGPAPDQRSVLQAGGIQDAAGLPPEFRDAIENFHRALRRSP